MITRPMLAKEVELEQIKFPVEISKKLDGIRALIVDGKALSRSFKPIPNKHIRGLLEANCPNGFDGELLLTGKTYNEVQTIVMTRDTKPEFEYWVFDYVKDSLSTLYTQRMQDLKAKEQELKHVPFLRYLYPETVSDMDTLMEIREKSIEADEEGLILRSANSPYKCNRSTVKEGWLLKLKWWKDSEGVVVGFQEQYENGNKKEVNELGLTKRSSKIENMIPKNTLGALLIVDLYTGRASEIGTGFTDEVRKEIWNNKSKYLGEFVSYRYLPKGMKNLPRHSSFKGFRSVLDMSNDDFWE